MRRHARTVSITVLAVGLMAFFLRNANPGRVWGELAAARWDLLLAGAAFSVAAYLLRVVRWQVLLRPVRRVSFPSALRATAVGFAANALLPGRVGELVRPWLLARRERMSAAAVFSTIVIERLLDLFVICMGAAAPIMLVGPQTSAASDDLLAALETMALISGLAAAGALGVLFVVADDPERAERLSLRLTAWAPHRVRSRIGRTVRRFLDAVAVTRRVRPVGAALAWSFPLWASTAASLWCAATAFGIELRWAGSVILMALGVIGAAAPTPAGIGGYHAAFQLGATVLYGASDDQAVGAALVLHLLWFGPITVLGLAFMGQDGLRLARLRTLARESADRLGADSRAESAAIGPPANPESRNAS